MPNATHSQLLASALRRNNNFTFNDDSHSNVFSRGMYAQGCRSLCGSACPHAIDLSCEYGCCPPAYRQNADTAPTCSQHSDPVPLATPLMPSSDSCSDSFVLRFPEEPISFIMQTQHDRQHDSHPDLGHAPSSRPLRGYIAIHAPGSSTGCLRHVSDPSRRALRVTWSNAERRVVMLAPADLHFSEVNGGVGPFHGIDHANPNWTFERGPFKGSAAPTRSIF